jgi:hypothetical protein
MFLADTPSMGLWLGGFATILVILACLAWIIFWAVGEPYDKWFGITTGTGVLLATIIIAGIAYYPYKHDYHYYVAKQGRVERINSRLIAADNSVSQRFVVVINGQPYGIDDTRASLLKEGDFVKLHCKKEFDWGSSDQGWACKWG